MADGNPQGFQDVEALLALAQLKLAPAPDHIQTVFGVNPQRLFQGEFMRRSVHQSQQVQPERAVHRSTFIKCG